MKAAIAFCLLFHSFSITSAERDGVKTRSFKDEELSYSSISMSQTYMAESNKGEDGEIELSYSMSHAYLTKADKADGDKKSDKKGDKKGGKKEGSKGGKGLSYSLSMDSSSFSMDAKAEKMDGSKKEIKKGDKKVDNEAVKEGSKGGKEHSYSLSMDSKAGKASEGGGDGETTCDYDGELEYDYELAGPGECKNTSGQSRYGALFQEKATEYSLDECIAVCDQFEQMEAFRGLEMNWDVKSCACLFDQGEIPNPPPSGFTSDARDGISGPIGGGNFYDPTTCYRKKVFGPPFVGNCLDANFQNYSSFFVSKDAAAYTFEDCRDTCEPLYGEGFVGISTQEKHGDDPAYCKCLFEAPLPATTPAGFEREDRNGTGPVASDDTSEISLCYPAKCTIKEGGGTSKAEKESKDKGSKGGKGLSYSYSTSMSMDSKAEKGSSKVEKEGLDKKTVKKTVKKDVKKDVKKTVKKDVKKDGKKDGEKDGKSGKMDKEKHSYSLSMDAKSGKGRKAKAGKFDKCVGSNPTLRFADSIEGFGCDQDDFECTLEYAELEMEKFSQAVEAWVDEDATPEEIAKMGEVGFFTPTNAQLCFFLFASIDAMEGTCYYNKYYRAYVNVAANGGYGFGQYQYNVLECTYDGKTFKEIAGRALTEETIKFIESGFA